MFEPTSRYYDVETVKMSVRGPDGAERVISYKRRRIIPEQEDAATLVEHTVSRGDRLDNITARYLGDPEQFWRVCDANNVLRPNDLTDDVGRAIKIALPEL